MKSPESSNYNYDDDIKEEDKVEEISEGRFSSAMAEIEDADRLLLGGLEPEKEGLAQIRESLIRISGPLFSTLLKRAKDESNPKEDRFKHITNLNSLRFIFGERIFKDLLRDNLTTEETVIELERKLSESRGFLKRLLS